MTALLRHLSLRFIREVRRFFLSRLEKFSASIVIVAKLFSLDGAMKQEANEKAFDNFANTTKQSDATKLVTITDQIEGELLSC